ncbi:MAG: hypothetical protein U0517_03780 [Candidatus Andersenbacteria bacterium]
MPKAATEHEMQLSSRCPLCNASFRPTSAEILDESRQGILFHLTCPDCQASLLAVVAASKLGLSSFGMVTDLTAADTKRLRKGSAINHQDVLQAYQELINFTGSFRDPSRHGTNHTQR